MADEINTLHEVITGMTSISVAFIAFVGRRFINKVDSTATRLEIHEKEDVGKYATMDQLERVHSRIDDSIKTSDDHFKELRMNVGEIKTLLIQGGMK